MNYNTLNTSSILHDGNLIYTILFFIVFLLCLFVTFYKDRNIAYWIIVIIEFFIASLRKATVGSDTYGYVYDILPILHSYNYIELFDVTKGPFSKEPFCYAFLKFISEPFSSYTPYFFILQAIFWISIGLTFYKYSKNPLLSLFVFIVFRFSFFNMTAMRQTIALAITTFSYKYYSQNKTVHFIFVVLLAFLFHRSAILFLLIFLFKNIDLYHRRLLTAFICMTAFFMGFLFRSSVFLSELEDSDIMYTGYLQNSSGGGNWFSIIFTFYMFVLIEIALKQRHDKEFNILYNILIMALVFSIAGFFNGLAFRVAMYFAFFIPILYANVLESIVNKNDRKTLFLCGMFSFVLIYIITGIAPGYTPYYFFWQ